jgi:Sulfotransferase domain
VHPAEPQPLIWIASYPKSGNTWVRFLTCNLLFGRQHTAASLSALAPDVHEMAAASEAGAAGLLKTHFAYSAELPQAARTVAAIYVVRHPADVLASNFFYSLRSSAQADTSPAAFDAYVEAFIAERGDPRWLELGMGRWDDHVRSWLHAPFPVLRIRYEDLTSDPLGSGSSIARMVRPSSTLAEVREAVENSSFERMRGVEREDIRGQRVGIFYKPYLEGSIAAGRRFMRRGIVGDGLARLNPVQRAALDAAFEPLLGELGY